MSEQDRASARASASCVYGKQGVGIGTGWQTQWPAVAFGSLAYVRSPFVEAIIQPIHRSSERACETDGRTAVVVSGAPSVLFRVCPGPAQPRPIPCKPDPTRPAYRNQRQEGGTAAQRKSSAPTLTCCCCCCVRARAPRVYRSRRARGVRRVCYFILPFSFFPPLCAALFPTALR